jgi:transcription initiation factor TFIID subunit 7
MQPGPDCDYLREVIEKKELNVTSDVWMKFKDARRAVVNVRGHLYGALLVDLPCIVEASKTLDKKNIFKAADISQMLLVIGRIQTEEEVWKIKTGFTDVTFAHGITPPMQFARKRRFRKRISNRTIEAVEAEVDRLLRDDEEADSTRFQLVDAAELDREETAAPSEAEDDGQGYDLLGEEGYDDEQDAEGDVEVEYEYALQRGGDEVEVDTLANDLENALFNGLDEGDEAMVEVAPLETPVTADAGHAGHAGDAGGDSPLAAPGEESETSDEDEDDEAAEPELDESQQEKLQQKEKLKEEVQDLEEMLATKAREFEKLENKMLKTKGRQGDCGSQEPAGVEAGYVGATRCVKLVYLILPPVSFASAFPPLAMWYSVRFKSFVIA